MSTRPRFARLSGALLAAACLVGLAPSAALADTAKVTIEELSFTPATKSIARGDKVRWTNTSFLEHDVKSDLSGYFTSPGGSGGMGNGATFTFTFKQAGTFGYLCRAHKSIGMRGTVKVPIKVSRDGSTFRVTVASGSVSGYRNRVQVQKPGSSTWQTISTTSSTSVRFTASKSGTYRFRSAVKRVSNGALSGYSPVVSKTKP